jgi:hypothetical protein
MINAIVITHDGYGLAATLDTIAQGSQLPDRIVVTCDGINEKVDRIVEHYGRVFRVPFFYVRREYKGRARRSQTRNNGVRALEAVRKARGMGRMGEDGSYSDRLLGLEAEDVLFFLDGHILLGANHFKRLEKLSGYDVVLSGFREGDRTLSEQIAAQGLLRERGRTLARRSPKLYVRSFKIGVQKLLRATDRAWGTTCAKVWWPSLCSANFAVKYGLYSRVNGFDEGELFDDWSPEDDDLGRRLYAAGATIGNATLRLGGFHLWHPSNREQRQRQLLAELPKYFLGPVEAHYGLRNPRDQEACEVKIDVVHSEACLLERKHLCIAPFALVLPSGR